ncbi:hypothetical protein [Flavobacterium rhizosphaerae]|uniref:Uncharacterized protein n=1 Tax=Flavobacterium rhizosphaerae TaxID=3163298 RepID=A0ABW8YZX8_9FLAO
MKYLKAKYKLILSYLKSDWSFDDYPLEIMYNPNAGEEKYHARLINWYHMIDFGKSRDEAIRNLKIMFDEYKNENELPRPGSVVPIKYATSFKVEEYEDIAIDFFEKILGLNYFSCFISDLSSLYDFDLANTDTLSKINEIYHIEPKGDYLLCDIFEQIYKSR